ncbi:IS1182 family transposase [Streptomyces sp. NPDC051658]|uniref:IS1182 family transposase n=1 Tax=Streptomyces sp. NPDC051658 TaxID=3365667 RepID=UPI0037B861C1
MGERVLWWMSSTVSWKAFAATVFVYQDSRARTTGDGPAAILLASSVPGGCGGSLIGAAAAVLAFRSRVGCGMSMRPRPWPKVPELTAQVARAVAARGPYPLGMRVRDELGELFADAEFAEAFGIRGRPGWSPGQLALVTVLQFAENPTDRAAAHRVRYGMDLKYALGLELDDPGFDASVLSEFRTRLVEHGMEEKVLDLLLTALKDRGLVKAGGKQRTDSPRVLAAVRDLNRLELAGETLRATLEALACAAPDWLAQVAPVREWAERYGPRTHSWHPPASTSKREAMALVYGRDGFMLLEAVHAPDAPAWLRELPAVQVLRTMWVQNYHRTVSEAGAEVKRRESKDLPPGRLRLASPYDTDARYGLKQGSWWTGYKIHISESCDDADDQDPAADGHALIPGADGPPPRLITGIATTDVTVTDAEMTEPVHHMLAARDLLPAEHFLDPGYASAELIVGIKKNFGITLVTPVLMNSSPQSRAGAGFDRIAFTIDWDKRQATCPRGDTSTWWSPATLRGTKAIVIKFNKETCRPCPVRDQCTSSKTGGRTLFLQPREVQEVLDHARLQQGDEQWRAKYATRAGIEGTIHQAVAVTGMRRARYLGLQKTHLEHVFTAVALNLIRLDAWWNGHPLDRTRVSHLARLDLSLAA